jgi:TatD DNase family protein
MQSDRHTLIDIGVNLTGSSFRDDVDAVIRRACDAGVTRMIVTGTDIEHSRKALALCRAYPGTLYATVGVHPHHADGYDEDAHAQLRDLAAEPGVVAIGECGLDFNRDYSPRDAQREAFTRQLQLAAETGLPVFLHQRDAHEAFIRIIGEHRTGLSAAVAHCFTGTSSELQDCLALDMLIGITGWICDERRGRALQQAVAGLPLERVMLETDAPYLLPRNLEQPPPRPRRNEPCLLPHILRETARFMHVDAGVLAQAALHNTLGFFRIE